MDIKVRIITNELGIRYGLRAIGNVRGDICLILTQTVAYVDDVAFLARSLKDLKKLFYKLQNESTSVRININKYKTK
jgi:hypothetical protein